MLLRHTASALALATTMGLGSAAPVAGVASGQNAPVAPPTHTVAFDSTNEIGGGPGMTCLGCVAAGVVALSVSGVTGIWVTFMVGGAQAVAYGGAAVTCVAACTAYLAAE